MTRANVSIKSDLHKNIKVTCLDLRACKKCQISLTLLIKCNDRINIFLVVMSIDNHIKRVLGGSSINHVVTF